MKLKLLFILITPLLMASCYSFTGGSVPEHLKTLKIANVNDNSGYGNPQFREDLTNFLISRFISDNTFDMVSDDADARLTITIKSIRDETVAVNPGELEIERKVTVECRAEYHDQVKNKQIFDKSFSNFQLYELTDALTNRNNAITLALEQVANDILLGVVSGW